MTRIFPSVSVPVLSNATQSMVCAISSAAAVRIMMPSSAPLPVPTMMAVGVARPSAQGQEMTSTAMAWRSASAKPAPSSSQTASVTSAMPMTTGTNTPLTRSASREIGAFEFAAASTSLTILLSAVSSPTFVARKRKLPEVLIVAPTTSSPTPSSTGRLSPVSMDWSSAPCPSRITPSVGTVWPSRTITMSPAFRSLASISTSAPSRTTVARCGARSSRREIASEVRPFARASRYLPTEISVTIIAADSK